MGLFKSKEEKEAISKEKLLKKRELFLKKYALGDIDKRDSENIINIADAASGLGLMDFANFLGGDQKEYIYQMLNQQQLEIELKLLEIKQNDRINKNLEELIRLMKEK